MNIKLRKGIIIVLICVLLLPGILACGETQNTNTNNTQDAENQIGNNYEQNENGIEDAVPLILSDLPDVTFNGHKFRIINTTPDAVTWLLTQIEAEEEMGEVLSDSIYRRNRIIEEKYDIEIEEIVANDPGDARNRLQRSAQAGSDDYDLGYLYIGDSLTMSQNGLLYEINSVPYIDLEKPWWDKDVVNDLSIANKLFGVAGDFCFAHYSAVMPIFFNKQMLANLGLEDPYQLVHDGKWTLEKFAELSKDASIDIDGNGTWNQHDQYGFMSLNFLVYPSFMLSVGERFVRKDANDLPYFAAGSPRFIDAYERIIDILNNNNRFFDADAAGNHRYQDTMFPGNQALFWHELMNWSKILREMEADFGIIPTPKFDEEQEHYYSRVFNATMMAIPVTVSDVERTGIILEALCAESYYSVKPVYYDTMLKTKISRDDESGEMLDIIFANRIYDMGYLYWNGPVLDPYVSLARSGSTDIMSYIERNESRIETAIGRTVTAIEDLD